MDDAFPFGLPRVSEEALEEYVRRNDRPEYRDELLEHIVAKNPTLLATVFAADADSIAERAGYVAVLLQTYALLSIQYELDMKIPKN